MDTTVFKSAEVTSNPVTSPEKLAGRLSDNKHWVRGATIFGLVFFCLYAYKTWLDVKLAKQQLKINVQNLTLNQYLLDDREVV
jgi:hypothetical protein